MYPESDQDQYLDNQENETSDEELEGSSDSEAFKEAETEDESTLEPQSRGGDLSVALRKEREKAKAREQELETLRQTAERQDAILRTLGQQKSPRFSEEEINTRLQDDLFNNPAGVLGYYAQQAEAGALQKLAPLQLMAAQGHLATHPEYGELYRNPTVKSVVDTYLEQQVASGSFDINGLGDVMAHMASLRDAFVGTPQNGAISTKGKEKLTSVVGKKTGDRRDSHLSEKERVEQALKLDPRAYAEWEKKNIDVVNRVLFGK